MKYAVGLLLLVFILSCTREERPYEVSCSNWRVQFRLPMNWRRVPVAYSQGPDSTECAFFFGTLLRKGLYVKVKTYGSERLDSLLLHELATLKVKAPGAHVLRSRVVHTRQRVDIEYTGDFYGQKGYFFRTTLLCKQGNGLYLNIFGPDSRAFRDTVTALSNSVTLSTL